EEVPELDDVYTICSVMESLGSKIDFTDGVLNIDNSNLSSVVASYKFVRKIRASFLIMGPLLARKGKVKISLPGGCAIGTRPINLHLKGFSAMGADISLGHGYIEANCDWLRGSSIYLDFPSV